mmetsp:Transcript_38820/g.89123  ORF Transcript_38820/g.89123 Transcript_38820/m.89123 type:complete len:147 (+) Transcript_38820:111-551(+)
MLRQKRKVGKTVVYVLRRVHHTASYSASLTVMQVPIPVRSCNKPGKASLKKRVTSSIRNIHYALALSLQEAQVLSFVHSCLRIARVLGHSFGAFRDCVFGQFTRENQADCSLDLARGESSLLIVAHELASLDGDALKCVVDERVHD